MPSAVTGAVRAESVDAADRLLLEQAHVCTTMPDIRKVVRFGNLPEGCYLLRTTWPYHQSCLTRAENRRRNAR